MTAEWVVGLIERSGHRLEELHEYLHPLDCNASAHYVSAPALSHSQGIAGTSSSRTSADVLDVKPSESTIDKVLHQLTPVPTHYFSYALVCRISLHVHAPGTQEIRFRKLMRRSLQTFLRCKKCTR